MVCNRKPLITFITIAAVSVFLISGCGKFDRSRIKMPEIKLVTAENLHSISCVDPEHIWASGNYGTILFSADSGKTWQFKTTGMIDHLYSVCFITPNTLISVGENGRIMKTTNK